ncbi:iron ABC transporter substrate-binding protein [Erythrobacter litoralis]|uniref:ABC transporter substrate-binding protein n=1 Tax=Erythrobacter litoralis TaxID=39960 RepID=UPI002434D94D|nr:ABC transporter substrate-binding protein [Erythrobacter litoralis]MDG6078440.1 iron ABC transporter substrate-binding protein [Erythrobacter litoralis]
MTRLAAALAVLLAGCASGAPTPPAERASPTIVSLNPCTDAILARVTEPGQLLAISHYSKDPRSTSMPAAEAARYPATGGTVEEVLALDPDVVVASTFIAPATKAAMDDLGLRVVMFGAASSIAESEAQVQDLAALAGHPDRGDRLVRSIELALAEARSSAESVEAALWQPGGIVPGKTSLIIDLLRSTGFSSYSANRNMAQADYLPLEQVVADPPEVLLVAGSEEGQRHPVLDNLPAMRREMLDTRLLYCGGPTIIRAAERLAEIRRAVAP